MKIKQYVMAYRANENEIKRLLPPGFESLRPVLRINVECFDGDDDWGYVVTGAMWNSTRLSLPKGNAAG